MTRDPATDPCACECPADVCAWADCYSVPQGPAGSRVLALRLLGCGAAATALAGIVLPLLPTTPFVLVAAWAFARSSPRLDAWLHDHPRLGPPLHAWETRRAIPARAKGVASGAIGLSASTLAFAGLEPAVLAAAWAGLAVVAGWILTRPS